MSDKETSFCFPVFETLESDRLLLTPFDPTKHASLFIDPTIPHPEVFTYLPFGPYASGDDFLKFVYELRVAFNPGYVLFSIFDKTRPLPASNSTDSNDFHLKFRLAGLIGLINTSKPNLATEIGCVMILPDFQRSHVASNAVGLLLHYCLDLPTFTPPDVRVKGPVNALALRRVCWNANNANKASIRLAERMGFVFEGVLRWGMVLPENKTIGNGIKVREGDPRADQIGRDTAVLALCWDQWEDGKREKVDEVMARVQ